MPSNVALAAFVFGAVLLLIALLGGGFKLFGAEVSGTVGNGGRTFAGVIGAIFLVIGLLHPFPQLPILSTIIASGLNTPATKDSTIMISSPTSVSMQATEISTPLPTTSAQVTDLTGLATASASSVLAPEQTVGFGLVHFDPGNALDRDPATSWVEGVAGPGIGEQLKLGFPRMISLTRLGIDIGFDRDEPIFYANNRLRRVRLIFSDGSTQSADFVDQRGIQYISIPNISTTSVVIDIEDVYHGSKYDDTAIAEVEVWGYASQ